MNKVGILIGLILVSEIIIAFVFAVTAQLFYKKIGFDFRSILKGLIERLFLMIALLNGYPHALTLFSALKLATRLKHNEGSNIEDNKFNDYYLIGNFVSVGVAMGYVCLYQYVMK